MMHLNNPYQALTVGGRLLRQSTPLIHSFLPQKCFPGGARIPLRSTAASKRHATSSSLGSSTTSSRKAVTVINDDGRVPWKELRTGEKVARTAQQSFNFGVVLAGLVGTGLVGYFLYQEVFAADSKTRHFNRAVDRVRADSRSVELLGSGKTIQAFGEPTANKWARARPIASSTQIDKAGAEHFKMHFNVQGSQRAGVVSLHMVKGPGQPEYKYQYLVLDVPGYPRHYLEKADNQENKKPLGIRMLGRHWR